jgi:DNA-binding response OmpR family regulator
MAERVLLVDDSLTVRMDLTEAFTSQGFEVTACATAAEARAALQRETFALAILDVILPDGDGVEILEQIRSQPATSTLPILMLSSEAEIKDRIRGLRTGADDYVGKPYDSGHVVARARELVRHRKGVASERDAVLVIDDSPTFREALRSLLEGGGYEVATAASGEEGLRSAALRRPAAIVVDGLMPGISGITLIRKVRLDAALRDTPCLLLTGSEDRDAELRALDAGADAFVRKEEDMQVILARLTAVLRVARSVRKEVVSLSAPKRILAVDDDVSYLHEVASALTDAGYDVVLAHSGEEALELLSVQSVDCILLDLLMPGMGGQQTCRQIKASPSIRDVPLILLAAGAEPAAVIEGLAAGADDYVSK